MRPLFGRPALWAPKSNACPPLTPALSEPQIAAVLKDCIESLGETWKASEWPVIVIGTTGDADKVPAGILGSFKEDFVISVRPSCCFSACVARPDVLHPVCRPRTSASGCASSRLSSTASAFLLTSTWARSPSRRQRSSHRTSFRWFEALGTPPCRGSSCVGASHPAIC